MPEFISSVRAGRFSLEVLGIAKASIDMASSEKNGAEVIRRGFGILFYSGNVVRGIGRDRDRNRRRLGLTFGGSFVGGSGAGSCGIRDEFVSGIIVSGEIFDGSSRDTIKIWGGDVGNFSVRRKIFRGG